MTYRKGIGQPETGAGVGVILWDSRTEVSFSKKKKQNKKLCSLCICNPRITIDSTTPGRSGWTLDKITNHGAPSAAAGKACGLTAGWGPLDDSGPGPRGPV